MKREPARHCGHMVLAVVATAALASPALAQQTALPPLVLQEQGSFFVGGRDVRSDTL